MFIGRNAERRTLEDIFATDRSNLVILYGRAGMGKTALIAEFLKEKNAYYYLLRECSFREQMLCMSEELESAYPGQPLKSVDELDYAEVLQNIVRRNEAQDGKQLIVLDEFHLGMKEGELAEAIYHILANQEHFGNVMFLLCSSSVNWVENEMVQELGMTAKFITNFMKLKELSFMEIGNWFPRMSIEDCIAVNAVIGGVPKYLKLWDERKTIAYNIKQLFLVENAPLYAEAEAVLKLELRELSAYNAILAAMASGKNKLNDIYERTAFSRAKISVYLKNLIKLDIVEKVFSADTDSNENVKKGLYRVRDNFLNFWYRFVFPNQSMIAIGQGEWVYEERIKSDFFVYQRESFSQLCLEYLKLMARHKRLRNDYDTWGSWHGKAGKLDVIAADTENRVLVAYCDWNDKRITVREMEYINDLCIQAKVKPAEIYVFSRLGVSAEAKHEYMKQPLFRVVELKDL